MARLDWYIRANLKFRHLQLLIAIDDYGNLGKVADILNVTQPALSKTLTELQNGLGVKLFERTGRGLKPTPYASRLIWHARKVLQDLADAGDDLHAIATGTLRKIHLGVLPSAAASLLPHALIKLKEQSPQTIVNLRESSMDILLSSLRAGELDVVLGTLPPRNATLDMEELALYEDATALVVRPTHPLSKVNPVSWVDVAGYPWILPPSNSLLRQPLLVAFSANGIEPPTNYIETLSINIILSMLSNTDTIASIPLSLARQYQSQGFLSILSLHLNRLVRPVGLIWIKDKSPLPFIGHLVKHLEDEAKNIIALQAGQ